MAEADANMHDAVLGRERELALLERYAGMSGASDGYRQVLVTGPAGVGVSTVIAAFAHDASRVGRTVISIDGRDGRELAALDADVDDRDPEQRRTRVLTRLADRARGGGVVVTVDHAERLAPSDALLLDVLDELDPALPITVVLGARSEDLPQRGEDADGGPSTAWGATLATLSASRPLPAVDVAPLPDDTVREILASRGAEVDPGRIDRVISMAGGIPAVATGLASSVTLGVDVSSLHGWVEERLALLDDRRHEAVQTVSLLVDGVHASALGLEAAQVNDLPFVRCVDGVARIEPAAIRDVIGGLTPGRVSRMLAAEAVHRLEELHGGEVDPARHGEAGCAAALMLVAGDPAGSLSLFRAIAHSHEAGLRPLEACTVRLAALGPARVSTATLLATLREAIIAFREVSDGPGSTRLLRQLVVLAIRAGDDEMRAYAEVELYFSDRQQGDVSLLERVVVECSDDCGWAWRIRGYLAFANGEYAAACRADERAIAIAHARGDEYLEVLSSEKLAVSAWSVGELARAEELLRMVRTRASALSMWRRYFTASTNLMGLLTFMARPGDALETGREAWDEVHRTGRSGQAAEVGGELAFVAVLVGALELAHETLVAAHRVHDEQIGTHFGDQLIAIADLLLAIERADSQMAVRADELVAAIAGNPERYATAYAQVVLVRAAAASGDADAAIEIARSLADDDAALRTEVAAVLARLHLLTGHEGCGATASSMVQGIPEVERHGVVNLYSGEVDAHLRRDLPALATIAADWERHGFAREGLDLAAAVSERLHADGQELPIDDLQACRRRCRDHGLRRIESRFNQLLRGQGVRAPARAAARGDRLLTEREEEIVSLVREGLSNAAIAERLGVRPATVARMLANIYKRLGTSGRNAMLRELDARRSDLA